MSNMQIIIAEMTGCLVAALLLGALFAYLFAKARSREYYENKIDALEELCESKKEEAQRFKAAYGNLEIENSRLQEEKGEYEQLLLKCRTSEEDLLTQLDVIAQENASLRQEIENLKQQPQAQTDRDQIEGEVALEKLKELKEVLHSKAEYLKEEIKNQVSEEIDQAEERMQKGVSGSKLFSFVNKVFGKINRKE